MEDQLADQVDRDIHTMRKHYHSWLNKSREAVHFLSVLKSSPNRSTKSLPKLPMPSLEKSSIKSSKSSKSRASSSREKLLKDQARLAELMIEKEFAIKQRKIEEEKNMINMNLEMEKTKARMKVYQEEDEKLFVSSGAPVNSSLLTY